MYDFHLVSLRIARKSMAESISWSCGTVLKTGDGGEPLCSGGGYASAPCGDIEAYRKAKNLRAIEMVQKTSNSDHSSMWLDARERYADEAGANLLFITFCVLVFTAGAIIFNTDVYKLVVGPLENMTSLVQNMSLQIAFLARSNNGAGGPAMNDNEYLPPTNKSPQRKVSNRSICMEFYLYFNKRAFCMAKGTCWPE
eukprot:COSAG05_NODE_1906_length_3849_cov_63.156800_3_plen_197_part_00